MRNTDAGDSDGGRSGGEALTIRAENAHSLDESERARHRLVLDLHDGPAQALSAAQLRLEVLASLLDDEQALLELGRLRELIEQASDEVYVIARELGPALVDSTGLLGALERHVAEFQERTGVRVRLAAEGDIEAYSTSAHVAAFRIVQEALTNAHKHGRAGTCAVELSASGRALECTIADDGCGFDVRDVLDDDADAGLGLRGMAERAALLDGYLTISSDATTGTRVFAHIPRWLQ